MKEGSVTVLHVKRMQNILQPRLFFIVLLSYLYVYFTLLLFSSIVQQMGAEIVHPHLLVGNGSYHAIMQTRGVYILLYMYMGFYGILKRLMPLSTIINRGYPLLILTALHHYDSMLIFAYM